MPTTSTERMRETRRRRARREVQVTIVLRQDDLATIAKAGPDYLDAVSADPKLQAEADSLFVSDTALDLT
jgi:hypothetical protein